MLDVSIGAVAGAKDVILDLIGVSVGSWQVWILLSVDCDEIDVMKNFSSQKESIRDVRVYRGRVLPIPVTVVGDNK